jgi:hypothetical protein
MRSAVAASISDCIPGSIFSVVVMLTSAVGSIEDSGTAVNLTLVPAGACSVGVVGIDGRGEAVGDGSVAFKLSGEAGDAQAASITVTTRVNQSD